MRSSDRPTAFRPGILIALVVVLLVLLLVAMACATIFESTHRTEQALLIFYKSRWFELLLLLLAVNMLASVVLRYPFSRRHVGFVLTHVSILVILAGALVTKYWGVDGQVGIQDGQTVNHFTIPQDALAIMIELNNKYALDGRNPNSYSGIFWVLGRYDRSWGPERPVFGKVRYMSSENTARKFPLRKYLARYMGDHA